jgi:hypothetical protein
MVIVWIKWNINYHGSSSYSTQETAALGLSKKKMSGKSRPKKMDMLDLIGGFYA